MMKLFKCAISVVGAFLAVYLLGSFIAWEFNPGKWDNFGRFVLTIIGAIMSAVAISIEFSK